MKNGIYFVTFKSNLYEYGEATIVVKEGIVNGGNYVCSYNGRVVNNILTLSVNKYCNSTKHIFGNEIKYRLLLAIKENENGYFMLGEMLENPDKRIEANAKFIGNIID